MLQDGSLIRPRVTTDAEGHFSTAELNGLGNVTLNIEHDEYTTARIDVGAPPFGAVDLKLEPRAPNRITGQVRGPRGAPLAEGGVWLYRGRTLRSSSMRVDIGEDGHVHFPDTAAGDYVIVVQNPEVGVHATAVHKPKLDEPHTVKIEMPFGIRATGTAVDEYGESVAGVQVYVGELCRPNVIFQGVVSDEDGRFTFPVGLVATKPIKTGWIEPQIRLDKTLARAVEVQGLVLYVAGPYDLMRLNDAPVVDNGTAVMPGDTRLDLVVSPRPSHPCSGPCGRTRDS